MGDWMKKDAVEGLAKNEGKKSSKDDCERIATRSIKEKS